MRYRRLLIVSSVVAVAAFALLAAGCGGGGSAAGVANVASTTTAVTTTSTTSTTSTEPATTTSTTTGATTTTSTTVAPSSLHATDCRAAPGGTALCEVELISGAGVEVATLQFNATVEPVASTPALLGPVGFAQDPDLPAPSLIQPEGTSTVLVGWLSPINPHLTGTRAIGRMSAGRAALTGQVVHFHDVLAFLQSKVFF